MLRSSHLIPLLACGLLLGGGPSVIAADDGRLSPDDLAILPWSWLPGDRQALEDVKACGFNLAGFVRPEHLDAVAAAGLKAIVYDPAIHIRDDLAGLDDDALAERVKTAVDRVGGHPAAYGYYLRDEPGAALYPSLARTAAALRAAAPEAKAYINLFPNYASAAQMGVPTYEEYVESFVNVVRPPFISYDHYALMDDGTLRGGYFENLEAIRSAALRHNLPFWNIVLSVAHFHYAEPTEAGLRFQVYTTLAYGGRGISYFTYLSPNTGNYRLAPIDQFGHKTATWDMMRRVNLQIHRLGPTYVQLRSINVFHHPNVPPGCSGIDSSGLVAELHGGDFVVGEFEGPDQQPFLLVVNKDLHKSVLAGIRLKSAGSLRQINAYTGSPAGWGGENLWLAAGQGTLLEVKRD
jgi:hypothetical protein